MYQDPSLQEMRQQTNDIGRGLVSMVSPQFDRRISPQNEAILSGMLQREAYGDYAKVVGGEGESIEQAWLG